ncbi:MAG: sarcosine oxidase subunit gamma family protein [Sneathiella sp.]
MGMFDHWVSPLAAWPELFSESLQELDGQAQINVRGNPDEKAFTDWIKKGLSISLPMEPNQTEVGKNCKALWLAPTEWMVIAPGEPATLLNELKSPPADLHTAITDVSANRVILELDGKYARDVLTKSCELDFHPNAFPERHVVQTSIAKSQAIIEHVAADQYHLYIRNSFARYAAEWLSDALKEYQD